MRLKPPKVMSKTKKLCSRQKKIGAVIYCDSNHEGQACEGCLDNQEACCREYCAGENLEVLRVFRETSESRKTPSQFDEMDKFLTKHGKDGLFLVVHSMEGRRIYNLVDESVHAPKSRTR